MKGILVIFFWFLCCFTNRNLMTWISLCLNLGSITYTQILPFLNWIKYLVDRPQTALPSNFPFVAHVSGMFGTGVTDSAGKKVVGLGSLCFNPEPCQSEMGPLTLQILNILLGLFWWVQLKTQHTASPAPTFFSFLKLLHAANY